MTGRKFFLLQGIGMIKFANSCFGSRSVCTECRVKGRSGFKLKGQNCSHTVFFFADTKRFWLKALCGCFLREPGDVSDSTSCGGKPASSRSKSGPLS